MRVLNRVQALSRQLNKINASLITPNQTLRPRRLHTSNRMAHIHTPIPSLKLNDGNSIPMLGFGTGTVYYKTGDESKIDYTLIENLKKAIGMDYLHLDGAEIYKTETELGRAIKESGVSREKFFITTKVAQGLADIPGALDASLKKLQLDYVDLYLIHMPFKFENDEQIQKAWAEMEKVQKTGKTKSIGVSNYLPKHLTAVLKTAKVVPAINQIEFHAYLQRQELINYHKKHGIATEAYGPLQPVAKASPGPLDDYLAGLAKKYAVNPSEILLRFCIDQDIVTVTTTTKEQRMSDFLRAMTFKLTPVEIEELCKLGQQKHHRTFWTESFDENDRT